MTNRSEQRVALISGASRGIGDQIGATLLEEGWRVSLGMRTPALPSWAAGHEEKVHLFTYDANDVVAEKDGRKMPLSGSVASMPSWRMRAS